MAGATPVTLLAGPPGSGKTALVERALADPRFRDTAVVASPGAPVPAGAAAVAHASGESIFRDAGCLCCRASSGLVRALRELHAARLEGRARFSRVVVEVPGLADPIPLLAAMNELPVVAARFALGGVVAVLDAGRAADAIPDHRDGRVQVAIADRIVLAKRAALSPRSPGALEAALEALNPCAPRLAADGDAAEWLALAAGAPCAPCAGAPHDPRIRTTSWGWPEPLPWPDVETALQAVAGDLGARLLRLRGLVSVAGEPGPRAVHAVGHTLYPSARLPAWPAGPRRTALVLVTEGLDNGDFARILTLLPSPSR